MKCGGGYCTPFSVRTCFWNAFHVYDMTAEVLMAMSIYLMMFMNMSLFSLVGKANILGNLLHHYLGDT
jgi:hypothetical protein